MRACRRLSDTHIRDVERNQREKKILEDNTTKRNKKEEEEGGEGEEGEEGFFSRPAEEAVSGGSFLSLSLSLLLSSHSTTK